MLFKINNFPIREEILSIHVPDENEEWMQLELKKLTQFTRIFPSCDPRNNKIDNNKSVEEEMEMREEENDEDGEKDIEEGNNNSDQDTAVNKDKLTDKNNPNILNASIKPASFEEILFQVKKFPLFS
jgi:hypothetical protein